MAIPAPADDSRINLQTAGVAVPGIDACELPGGRDGLTNMIESSLSVRAPASHGAIRPHAARVVQAGTH